MGFLTVIVILTVGWLIYEWYRKNRPEPPETRIETYEKRAVSSLKSLKSDYKVVYGLDELDERVLAMKDWCTRLKERYKHDKEKLVQIAEDWDHYLEYQSSLASNIFQRGEVEDREGREFFKAEIREDKFKIEEIENRFAHLLGKDYEKKLEQLRKKEMEEV